MFEANLNLLERQIEEKNDAFDGQLSGVVVRIERAVSRLASELRQVG